jgi:hypothetical protein
MERHKQECVMINYEIRKIKMSENVNMGDHRRLQELKTRLKEAKNQLKCYESNR